MSVGSMYYHFAILLLFRPLIKLRIIGSSVSPRDVCLQAAEAITSLLRSYSQLYTLRRTPSFVPYFVLTSSIMHLAIAATKAQEASGAGSRKGGAAHRDSTANLAEPPGSVSPEAAVSAARSDPEVVRSINQGIADLTEMAPCHHFAEQALNILRHLAKRWKIEIDIKFHTDRKNKLGELASQDEQKLQEQRREQQQQQDGPHQQEHQQQQGRQHQQPQKLLHRQDERLQQQRRRREEELEADQSVRPVTSSLNFFAPDVSDQDYVCSWGGNESAGQQQPPSNDAVPAAPDAPGMTGTVPVAGADLNQVVSATSSGRMANPLFWPFPMQGKPMLPTGKALLEAGFELYDHD